MTRESDARRFRNVSTHTAPDPVTLLLGVMRSKRWNQREAADALGVSEGAISRWIGGTRPLQGTAAVLVRALATEVSEQAAAKPARRSARKVNSRKR